MAIRDRILAAALSLLVAGCTSMTESLDFDYRRSDSGFACRSSLGAYSLPRRLIKIEIVSTSSNPEHFGIAVNPGDYIPDPHQIYCLDFLASRVADERIGIQRSDKNRLLLERVYTRAIDKTKENAQKLIQGVADLVSFGQSQSLAREAKFDAKVSAAIREFNVDPLIQQDMRKVNAALKPFGYCVYLKRGGDSLVPDWSEHLCDTDNSGGWRPYKTEIAEPNGPSYAEIVDKRPVPQEIRQKGIFYRPEVTHVLVIMKQEQQGVANSPWHRDGSMRIALPNAAPPFLLRVERSFFTDAETDVHFKEGIIQSVAVDKKSELLAVSQLAVEIVQIVQKIPQVTLAIFDNTVANRLALIDANQKLITTLQDYNEARGLPRGDPRTLTPSTNALITQGYAAQRSAAPADPMSQCLSDPAIRNDPDPAARCRDVVKGNL